jgi:PDZ domain-containing protein
VEGHAPPQRRRRWSWYQRGAAILAGIALVGAVLWFIPTNYTAFAPGITGYLPSMVSVKGGHPSRGTLLMVAIYEIPVNELLYLWAHVNDNYQLVPTAEVMAGITPAEYETLSLQQMQGSQANAEVAGERAAGLNARVVTEPGLEVLAVLKRSSAFGRIRPGDVILRIGGRAVSYTNLASVMAGFHAGETVPVVVRRQGKLGTVHVKLMHLSTDPNPAIGVEVTVPTRYVVPRPVKFSVQNIGGPSAGMMFSLEIYEQITGINLAKGRVVAGTGEITPTGQVLEIGGVAEKVITVHRAGATVFLCPKANYAKALATARAHGYHMTIYPVTTLHQAIVDLERS